MADGKVVIETDLDSSGIENGLSKLGSVAEKGLKATMTAVAGTTTALAGAGTAAVKVGSDFEAGMSKVAAISGATGSDFDALTEKAKEMGAKTKFSASESAAAMEYMAMAGWKTEDMLSGIEGIMNLAAASGEDLATTSDIVTDALTAFGLSAEDSTHFADVLAQASSNANTNVGMMGETFKYVAPVAGALGFSAEDCATAIGLMANAGIKGSQAGTSLRSMFSRLANPTDEVAGAMMKLGVSLTDSEGNMKSLDTVMQDLREGFDGLSEAEAAQMASSLAGQDAMSGLLAIVNASDEDFKKLKDSIYNADGAASRMAETMQDNLQGSITILKSGLEGLGIEFYESVKEPLKDAADETIDAVSRMTDAFRNGGLDAAVEEAGFVIADFAVEAAEHAPEMVDVAVSFIESFANGVVENKEKLIYSAVTMAETLAGGLADLLPSELEKPVDKAIEAVSKSLESGGLKKAGKTAVKTFDNVIDAAGELAEDVLPPLTKALDFAGENLELLASSSAAVFTAFKGYKVVNSATKGIEGLSAVTATLTAMDEAGYLQLAAYTGALSAKEMAVGILTGKVTLATAAQTAWNAAMSANPIGIVIAALGALAAGLAVYKLTTKEASEETYKLSESQKKTLESCKEVTDTMAEERDGREKNIQAIDREYDKYDSLVAELQTITDENGKVKEGYQERAKVITGELADALGTEIEMTDDVIQNYQETIDKIKEVIVQKKAEALLSSMQGEMAKAYEETEKAIQAYKDASAVAAEKDKDVAKAVEAAMEAHKKYEDAKKSGSRTTTQYAYEVEKTKKNLKDATAAQKKAQESVDSAKNSMSEYAAEVNNYNALMDAMATGETAKIEAAITALVTSYKAYSEETLATSQKAREEMYAQANGFVENMKLVQDGSVEVADSVYQDMAKAAVDSINEFSKLPNGIAEGIEAIGPEASKAMISALVQANIDGKLDEEAKAGLASFIDGFSGLNEETQKVWGQAWYGALDGLDELKGKLKDPATEGADAFLESLKSELEVHSPSRAVKEIFSQVWPGALEGLENGQGELNAKGEEVSSSFIESFGNLKEKAKGIGANVLNFFGIGIKSQRGTIDGESKAISDSLNKQLGSADTKATGKRQTSEYNSGLSSNSGNINTTSKSLSNTANSGMGSADTRSTGQKKSNEYNAGLGSANTYSTGSKKAKEGKDGLNSVDTSGTGKNFIQGFINGFGLADVWSAAWSIGKKALSSLSKAIKEGSPSRLTKLSGKYFGQGFELGIEGEEKAVSKASDKLAKTAIASMDMADVTARMREVMALNASRVSHSLTLQSDNIIENRKEINSALKLSDEDIRRLARQFGTVAGNTFADNMSDTKIVANMREVGRIVREVQN